MMDYNENVLRIFKDPKRSGKITKADAVGEVGNARCGDIMRLYLKVDENEKILDAKFQTFGCFAAIASTETACDMIIGKTLDEALKLTNKEVLDRLGGLPDIKIHCSVLAEEVIQAAVLDFRKKQAKKQEKENK